MGEPWTKPTQPTTTNKTTKSNTKQSKINTAEEKAIRDLKARTPVITPEKLASQTKVMPLMQANPNMDMSVQPYDEQPVTLGKMNTLSDTEIANLNKQAKQAEYTRGDEFKDKYGQYLPSIISGASNIAGNLLLANKAKNIPKINPAMVAPERINLTGAKEQARRDAEIQRNTLKKGLRDVGANTGATLTNIATGTAGIDRNLGSRLTSLDTQEAMANAQFGQQAGMSNQAAMNMARQIQAQMEQQALQDRLGYYNAAFQAPQLALKDYRQQQMDMLQQGMWDRYMSQPKGHYFLNTKTGKIELYD